MRGTGMITPPAYPKIRRARAIRSLFSRRALLLMSLRDKWPRTMAKIAVGNNNHRQPQTRLAIAFLLLRRATATFGFCIASTWTTSSDFQALPGSVILRLGAIDAGTWL